MSSTLEKTGIVGHLVAEMRGPDGEVKSRVEVKNLITQAGDEVIARRAANVGPVPAAPTGMRIGTGGSVAATKTGSGSSIVTRVTGGNKGFDTGFPTFGLNGSSARVTWRTTFGAGEGTSGTTISEAVLVNDTITTDAASGASNTVARVVLPGLGVKGANDTLILTWTWDHQGT